MDEFGKDDTDRFEHRNEDNWKKKEPIPAEQYWAEQIAKNIRGRDVDSADRSFKAIYIAGTALGVLGPIINIVTGMTVVEMVVLFAAYSGIVSLPITTVLLFWAVNDDEIMGEHTNGFVLNVFNVILVVLAFVLAALSLPDLLNTLTTGGL